MSLFRIARLYRSLVGRRIYILALLMPLSALLESVGIALLLPLLQALDHNSLGGGPQDEVSQGALSWVPLPSHPATLLILVAALFLLKAIVKFASEGLLGYFAARLTYRLKLKCVDGYTHLDYGWFSQRNTGHYINIVTTQIQRLSRAFGFTIHMLVHGIAAVTFLGAAALVNWKFAAIATVAGLLITSAMQQLTAYVRSLSRRTAAEMTILNKQLVQVIHALKYLMATNRTKELATQVHSSCKSLFGFQYKTGLAHAFTAAIREPLSVVLILSLVAVQIYVFNSGLAAVLVSLLLLHRSTQALMTCIGEYQKTMELSGSAELVQQELIHLQHHQEPRGRAILPEFTRAVEFKNVSFAYDADLGNVLDDICITIPQNHTVAIVGRSGAGKSTLADLLTLLLRPTSGKIEIDGQDVQDADPRSWRRQLGYVCQETIVFDDTIAANICLDHALYTQDEECQRRVEEAARLAFAAPFIDDLPERYNTVVGDRGVRLSGGQRQRLFIARELYKQPRLLILDEATSALDGEAESAIQQSIENLHGKLTVLVIAHRLATIKNADIIYVLDNGELVEQGGYIELHSNAKSTFRRMVELQSL